MFAHSGPGRSFIRRRAKEIAVQRLSPSFGGGGLRLRHFRLIERDGGSIVAEGVGFEPTEGLLPR